MMHSMILDGELLERYAKDQDQDAFAELVRRHLDGVFSAALRRVGGDQHLAEDVAQHVFIELARQSRRLVHHPVLTGWLYVTTRNQAVMLVRTEQRRKRRETEAHLMNELQPELSSDDWNRIAPVLDWAIEQLPETDRAAVLLRFVGRKPFEEIGSTLKVSSDAARMRVDRAIDKLRSVLARKGIVSTTSLLAVGLTRHAAAAAPTALSASVTAKALATLPAAVGILPSIVQFMTTSKLAAGVGSVLLVVAIAGVGAQQWNEWNVAQRELVGLAQEADQLTSKLERAEARLHAVNTKLTEQKSAAEAASQHAAQNARTATAVVPPQFDPESLGKEFLNRHPEAKEALAAWLKSAEDENYGDLFKTLHLTPEQIEKFRALVRENHWFGRSLGDDAHWANFSLGTGKKWETIETEMAALLGPEGMRQYTETLNLENPRRLVTTAAADLVFTTEPMTARQADELTASIKTNTTNSAGGPVINWNNVEADAGVILSPAQMRAIAHIEVIDETNVQARKPDTFAADLQKSKAKATSP